MVRVKVSVLLCDYPLEGDDFHEGDAEEWFFTAPGKPRCPIHLCQRHAEPLHKVFQHAPTGPAAPEVKTMEQIEREKAAAKAAASRAARKRS